MKKRILAKILSSLLLLMCNCTSKSSNKQGAVNDLFGGCDSLIESKGAIQSIRHLVPKDSLPLMYTNMCMDKNNFYEIIFSPKFSLKEWRQLLDDGEVAQKLFDNNKATNFPNFECYKIITPIVQAYGIEESSGSKVKFPAEVSVYKRHNNSWEFLMKRTFNDFETYDMLRFALFYRKF